MTTSVHSETTGAARQSAGKRRRLIPLSQWPKYHPWPSVAGMRHIRFHSETNGFKDAFRTVGRRVLVDEAEFFAAVDRQNGQAA